MTIRYKGGGLASDTTKYALPQHNPNDGGPRSSGAQLPGQQANGVRPSYGLFIRQLRDASFQDVSLQTEGNDDRLAVVLIDSQNVSFSGRLELSRGAASTYDFGLRNCSRIHVAKPRVKICEDYPQCLTPQC